MYASKNSLLHTFEQKIVIFGDFEAKKCGYTTLFFVPFLCISAGMGAYLTPLTPHHTAWALPPLSEHKAVSEPPLWSLALSK
jgi:hypothetical protein